MQRVVVNNARNARRRIAVVDSFALSNRGFVASAKTQVRRVAAVLSAAVGALLLISTSVSAQVANRVVGPTDPRTGFPVGLIDERGTSLAPCVDDIVLCPSTLPDLGLPAAVPGNFPDEFFYSFASADLDVPGSTVATLVVAIEGSFVNAPLVEAGQQVLFGRVRVRIRGGLTVGTRYRITHPYGVLTTTAVDKNGVGFIDQTQDIGCLAPVPGIICPPFTPVVTSTPWPFLIWNPAVAPAAPAGYIGAPGVLHTVVGSPTGNNLFRLEELHGGGNGADLIDQTNLFSVAGKRIDFTPPTATVTSPLAGATVSGTVQVRATATDNVGVTSLQIQLDGVNLGPAGASSPVTVSWNTTLSAAGTHRLSAIARDLAGNVGTSADVQVTVNNAAPPPPALVTVPNVVGQTQATAQTNITNAGLVFAINRANSATVPAGVVISQTPVGGASAARGSTVTLLVSSGQAVLVRTPDVVGRPLADAQSRIADVGLTSTVTSANDPKVKAGEIISQSPGRDTLVPSGSNVALVVSLGS
jgi:hypothetical protein